MIFNGINDQTVEIKITNYQFPDKVEGEGGCNWLNIYLKVKSDLGNWQTIDPALTTWEVQKLIDWLNTLSSNENLQLNYLCFTEPNLSFELLNNPSDDLKKIKIHFELEFRPRSAKNNQDYFVEIEADNEELKRLAFDLEKELAKYPERKKESLHSNKKIRSKIKKLWSILTGKKL